MIVTKEMDTFVGDLVDGVVANGPFSKKSLELILAGVAAPTKLSKTVKDGFLTNANLLKDFSLITVNRLAHFLGQVSHETGGFKYLEELGGARYFERYEGRTDLGNTEPGDGVKYHGRGLIQLTGRNNYTMYGKVLGLPLVEKPELAKSFPAALQIALHYWTINGLHDLADRDLVSGITKRINGGFNGLAERIKKVEAAKAAIAREYLACNLIRGE